MPLADLLRARLATARGFEDAASWSYDNVRAAGPDHDGLRLESAAALASFGLERQSEVETIQIAEMGSRAAEVWYLKAQLALLDGKTKEGETILRQAWTERPILREELFGDPALATLVARPTLFPLIEPGSPQEPTVEAPGLGRRAVHLPAGARTTALGRLLRIEVPGSGNGAVIEIPAGAELAPPGTRLADAAEWKRHDQQVALGRLDALTDQARGMTAFGQPRLRRQILEAAAALAEADRWDDLVLLTDGIENQVERVPAVLGQLRALALRKTSRVAEARGLLVRLAKASMSSRRPAAGVLYQLAELFVSDRELDTALRLLRKASALSPLARNDARIQQIRLEQMPGRINPIPDLAERGRVISLPMIEAILDGFGEPQLVDLAYGEAAWVIHYLEAVHGVETIRAFADAYSRGLSTEQAVREVLNMSVAELDHAVWDWSTTEAPPSWPTELVRYDRKLEGLTSSRSAAAREIVDQARGDDRRPTMATWYQTYNREVVSFKTSLRDILGPLNEGEIPKPIACVTLSGQINRLLQDREALHPPDETIELALGQAFHDFAAMAQACSRGDAESARASLTRAEQALGAAAHELERYGMRP